MFGRLILALLLGFLWALISGAVRVDVLLVGAVTGFLVLTALRVEVRQVTPRTLPGQIIGFLGYSVQMFIDIFLSSVDVARRVLAPRIELRSGIIAVPTQSPVSSDFVSALSAHSITITPGELVVEFDGHDMLFVHCLDVEASEKTIFEAQARRAKRINRILGNQP